MKKPKKKRSWWQGPPPPAWLAKRAGGGRGVSKALVDRAFWIDFDPNNEPWFAALEALDKHDNAGPLLALLPPDVAPHYRDLFKRKRVVARKGGNRATPSYERTAADALLELAGERVSDLVAAGAAVDDAIAAVSDERKIPESILHNSYLGKRGSLRRKKKRCA